MTHILEFDSIRLSFKDRSILSDIYMKCETGKITGLLGRNGQGKSCLFNIVYGVLEVDEKSIRFDNISVPMPFKRPALIRYLPQFDFMPGSLKVSRVFDDFEVDYLEFEKRFPEFTTKAKMQLRHLSGGQLRFVQTYLILQTDSLFAILDEPFTHLMPIQIEKLMELIVETRHRKGLLITDHLYRQVIDLADNLYLLKDGRSHPVRQIDDLDELGYARL